MLEILLGIGTKKTGGVAYPDSGPGTKILQYGDTTAGFFGEVTAAELMDSQQVYQLSGLANGQLEMQSGLVWLKFFLDNKVLFIAKRNVVRNVAWSSLYSAGVIYGKRGNGTYPEAVPVDQRCGR
jgi:hypothetical protein